MNKVVLIGRLTRDPDARTSSSGTQITRFTLAVDRERRADADSNQPTADFISCVTFGKPAETVAKYCHKGMQVAVDGRVQTGSYDGQDGQKRYTTDIVCSRVEFLGSKNSNAGSRDEGVQEMPDYNDADMPSTDVTEDPFSDFGDEVTLSDDDLPF